MKWAVRAQNIDVAVRYRWIYTEVWVPQLGNEERISGKVYEPFTSIRPATARAAGHVIRGD
jgi:hypothetical protein